MFHRAAGKWSQTAYLKSANNLKGSEFGTDVALSGLGTTLVVGAALEPSNGTDPSDTSLIAAGAVYVFELAGTTWTQRAYLKAPHPATNDQLGQHTRISTDGKIIAFSDLGDDTAAMDAGSVAVFSEAGGIWQSLAILHAPLPAAGDFVGVPALSATGSTLAIGAHHASTATGAVYLFYSRQLC
jgi:hypothetical protein